VTGEISGTPAADNAPRERDPAGRRGAPAGAASAPAPTAMLIYGPGREGRGHGRGAGRLWEECEPIAPTQRRELWPPQPRGVSLRGSVGGGSSARGPCELTAPMADSSACAETAPEDSQCPGPGTWWGGQAPRSGGVLAPCVSPRPSAGHGPDPRSRRQPQAWISNCPATTRGQPGQAPGREATGDISHPAAAGTCSRRRPHAPAIRHRGLSPRVRKQGPAPRPVPQPWGRGSCHGPKPPRRCWRLQQRGRTHGAGLRGQGRAHPRSAPGSTTATGPAAHPRRALRPRGEERERRAAQPCLFFPRSAAEERRKTNENRALEAAPGPERLPPRSPAIISRMPDVPTRCQCQGK